MLGCAPNLETNKEIELDFIVRSLEATAAREIEEKAFELVGREPDEAEADLDQACRALAREIVRQHGTSAADACLLVEGLGRAIIARASRMTYVAGINLRPIFNERYLARACGELSAPRTSIGTLKPTSSWLPRSSSRLRSASSATQPIRSIGLNSPLLRSKRKATI